MNHIIRPLLSCPVNRRHLGRTMLDLNYVRQHPDAVREALSQRGMDLSIDRLLELDGERRRAALRVLLAAMPK